MKTPVIAQVFAPFVVTALIKASQAGKPNSIERRLAIESAEKTARNVHPNLFRTEK